MITVTKPFLPPKEEYYALLYGIWKRNWVTNLGPLEGELKTKLKEHLGLEYQLYVGNGTIAVQLAIKGLDLKGEFNCPTHRSTLWFEREVGYSKKIKNEYGLKNSIQVIT